MLTLGALLGLVAVAHSAQPSAPPPKAAPIRDLPWGQLNFLHTTDIHGWFGGHLQEPSYSADWGDYISFATHLRAKADKDGVDLIVLDSGDRVEGNGLYDASDPKGKFMFDIVKQQHIDVICSGNHELYKARASQNEFDITVPNFKGNYLASNLDIRMNSSDKFHPLAPRFKKFTTKNQGYKIMAFGFMFDFTGNANNTIVTPVEETIKEEWFQDAIRDRDVDLFLIVGHVPVRDSKETKMIFEAIRAVQWRVPIHFFGGHTHIRDYKKYDSMAYALESGRYMETVGFASIDGLKPPKGSRDAVKSGPTFKRRYIDNNLFSYHHHTGLDEKTFPTELGRNVSEQIAAARKTLKLDETYGCAPRNLWLYRAKYNSTASIFDWLDKEVISDQFSNASDGASPTLVITNTGAVRFDVFRGRFTRDTTFLVSPFTSGFAAIKGVDRDVAYKVLKILNTNAPVLQRIDPSLDPSLLMPPRPASLDLRRPSGLADDTEEPCIELEDDDPDLLPGYTTKDDAGSDGDDTVHAPIKFYKVPNCMGTEVDWPKNGEPEKVDLAYNDFLEPWIFQALKFFGYQYGPDDTTTCLDGQDFGEIIVDWIKENWPCNRKDEL